MKRLFFILFFSLAFFNLPAQDIPERPDTLTHVNDYDNILSETEKAQLEKNLIQNQNTANLTVIVFKSLTSEVNDYAKKLFDTWNLQKLSDKEVLMLIDFEDREYSIVSSPSLSEILNTHIETKIEENYIKHHFRDKEYYKGLEEASNAIFGLVNGTITPAEIKRDETGVSWLLIIISLIIFFIIIFPIIQYRSMKKNHLGSKPVDFLNGLILINSYGAASRSGFNDFSKGDGKFIGRAFGGFGGGGGAEGSW